MGVRHVLAPPPAKSELIWLKQSLGGICPEMEALYAQHDGAHLFATDDPGEEDAGFHLCAISEMEEERASIAEWFDDEQGDDLPKMHIDRLEFHALPSWFDSVLVFGRFGHAAERLCLACKGPLAGTVLFFEHDGLALLPLKGSFSSLLQGLMADPVCFFEGHEGNAFQGITEYAAGG